jgi:hypothetical protein
LPFSAGPGTLHGNAEVDLVHWFDWELPWNDLRLSGFQAGLVVSQGEAHELGLGTIIDVVDSRCSAQLGMLLQLSIEPIEPIHVGKLSERPIRLSPSVVAAQHRTVFEVVRECLDFECRDAVPVRRLERVNAVRFVGGTGAENKMREHD